MVNIYCLSYRVPDFAIKSIDSLLSTASEQVRITVIDNHSHNSYRIARYMKRLVDAGHIDCYIQLKNNSMIWAFQEAYRLNPPPDEEKFVMFSELDLIIPENLDWVKETRKMQEQAELTGFGLSLENYVPPNGGHLDDNITFGIWLMAINKGIYDKFSKHYKQFNLPLADYKIRDLTLHYGGRVLKGPNVLYHLGWDIWKVDKEYWEEKMKGIQWDKAHKPLLHYIYKKENSNG